MLGEYDQNMFHEFSKELIKIFKKKEMMGEEEEFHVSILQCLFLLFP